MKTLFRVNEMIFRDVDNENSERMRVERGKTIISDSVGHHSTKLRLVSLRTGGKKSVQVEQSFVFDLSVCSSISRGRVEMSLREK